jgi:nitroimidazol reductase NimA-like FMN-containing flavoprotein (pyridoxamine 5'-phosphate oxidase superfamily)
MGVALDEGELWRFLDESHTGILTTLRSDGWPVALPVWFVCHDHRVYVRTPARTRKVDHVRRDPRVCFTAEAGVLWAELRAVVLTANAVIVPEGVERDLALGRISEKYKAFGIPFDEVPAATLQYYDTASVIIRIDPAGHTLSWDNRKLRRRTGHDDPTPA